MRLKCFLRRFLSTLGLCCAIVRADLASFNAWFADKLADALATMSMFYGVLFIVTLPLRWQTPEGAVAWINYMSSNFFQAVALPVLAFVAKREGVRQAALLQETHDAVMQEIQMLKALCKD
jgi:hypothetical protein